MWNNLSERAVVSGLSALALMVDQCDMLRQEKAELEAHYEALQESYDILAKQNDDLFEGRNKDRILVNRLLAEREAEREAVAEWLDAWLYCDANDYDLASNELDSIRQASYDYVAEHCHLLAETFMVYDLVDSPEEGADEKETGTPPASNTGDIPF